MNESIQFKVTSIVYFNEKYNKGGKSETYVLRGFCSPEEVTKIRDYVLAENWKQFRYEAKDIKILKVEIV